MLDNATLARQCENAGDWAGAWRHWENTWNKTSAAACKMIHDANIKGDEYRRRVGPEPDKILNAHQWVKWYDNMGVVYREMYGPK